MRYICPNPNCGAGGAGEPDKQYVCHLCKHEYMIPVEPFPNQRPSTRVDVPGRILGIEQFQGRVLIATELGVFELGEDNTVTQIIAGGPV